MVQMPKLWLNTDSNNTNQQWGQIFVSDVETEYMMPLLFSENAISFAKHSISYFDHKVKIFIYFIKFTKYSNPPNQCKINPENNFLALLARVWIKAHFPINKT